MKDFTKIVMSFKKCHHAKLAEKHRQRTTLKPAVLFIFVGHNKDTKQTLPTCFQRHSAARSASICIFVVSMNIWSETPIIDLVLKVEVGCPQNDSVKNGCQGATMGRCYVVIYG